MWWRRLRNVSLEMWLNRKSLATRSILLGGMIFLTGTLIAVLSTISMLFFGYKLFKIPYTFLGGMSANQPAILDFAIQNSGNQLPNIGYALMFPIAIILKIVYVQILFVLL